MHRSRVELLAEDVCNDVFEMLDGEPGITTDDAGYIAARVQVLIESLLLADDPRDVPHGRELMHVRA